MQYTEFCSNKISRLGYGCMRFPKVEGSDYEIDEKKARELLEYAYDHGVNYYDTAWPYHMRTSERFLGSFLKTKDRSSFFVATKLPLFNLKCTEEAEEIFNKQRENLGLEYFDYYLLHAVNKERFEMIKRLDLYEFLVKKKEEGLIRNLGFSFHDTPQVLDEITNTYSFDFAQIQLNYIDWELQNARLQYEILTSKDIPVIVMEPCRGGALSSLGYETEEILTSCSPDNSISSWAFRYVKELDNVHVVLSGMSNMEQLKDNIKTFSEDNPFKEKERKALDAAIRSFLSNRTIKCTKCRYCMPCSVKIEIPEVFSVYNSYLLSKDRAAFIESYSKMTVKANECIDCQKCVKACPQGLEINKLVKEVDRTFMVIR